ncbi:MAG TPA: PH domain-containing protein [Acidimicrobiales bacterium]|nr:PH domain-containing protein [Acidimicrobiales bacterium]
MTTSKKYEQIKRDAAPALMPGEEVLDATTGVAHVTRMGQKTTRRGSILLTDRRVLVFTKKLGGYDVQDFVYGLITGVDHKKGFTAGHITIRASGDTADIQQVDKNDVERIAQAIRDQVALTGRGGPVAPAAASLGDELAKLAVLRDQGVISPAEFDSAKARLLA